jgi:hypothetical protein
MSLSFVLFLQMAFTQRLCTLITGMTAIVHHLPTKPAPRSFLPLASDFRRRCPHLGQGVTSIMWACTRPRHLQSRHSTIILAMVFSSPLPPISRFEVICPFLLCQSHGTSSTWLPRPSGFPQQRFSLQSLESLVGILVSLKSPTSSSILYSTPACISWHFNLSLLKGIRTSPSSLREGFFSSLFQQVASFCV